jgi:hypothetical protein
MFELKFQKILNKMLKIIFSINIFIVVKILSKAF